MEDTYKNYLRDAVFHLVEAGRDARRKASLCAETSESLMFEKGRAFAYYEVIDYLVQQLEAFGIERSAVDLDANFDAARELL